MIDDLDLEELESRLYSQVYHTSVEEIANETTSMSASETANNNRKQNIRYFQAKLPREDVDNSSKEGYIQLDNSNTSNRNEHNDVNEMSDKPLNNSPHIVHTKARAADFFDRNAGNMRQIVDVQMSQGIPQILHMINPCNNILLFNQIPTQVISHNYIPASHQINTNQEKYLARDTKREANRLKRIANRKRKKEFRRKQMSQYKKLNSSNEFHKNKNIKKEDFKVHLTENVASLKPNEDKEQVLTISDSGSDSDSCFEVIEKRELIVLSSDDSDSDASGKPEKEPEKIKKQPEKTIKQEIKLEKSTDTEIKTKKTKDITESDDDILLIDDIPKDLEIIEIDCDANSIANAESNKNSSERSIETNSTSSDLKTTPKKRIAFPELQKKKSFDPKERNVFLRTPDSTSNDFLDSIDLRQQKFNFALHGADFGENNHNFVKPRTINSETESTASTSEITLVKNTFFNEIEFDTPNKELFNEQNLETFGNYITPNRKEKAKENSSRTTGDFEEILTKASKRYRPKSPSEAGNSDSSSECDYNVQRTPSKMRKTLPDLTSINAPSSSKSAQELDKKQIENVNKRKSDTESTISKKKSKGNSDILEITKDSILSLPGDKKPTTDATETKELKEEAPGCSKEHFLYIDDDTMSVHSSQSTNVIIETTDLQLGNLETPKKQTSKKKSQLHESFSKYWTSNMDKFYNTSWGLENYSTEEMQKAMSDNSDLWKIRDEDRTHLQLYNNRIRCNKCNERGHIAARCPNPLRPVVCSLCGETGHYEPRCPNGLCTSCGTSGGYTTYCSGCAKWRRIRCTICSLPGHIDIKCPDLWRRYHLTTEPGPIVKPLRGNYKKMEDRWCPGCARNRHFDYKCRTHPQVPTVPYIIDYTDVYNFPKSQPFLIHCDLTKTPSSTITNTTKITEETITSNYVDQSPSCSSSNNEKSSTINTMNFKGNDYKGRFDNIFPPFEMIPEYFREQFMYIEKSQGNCDNEEVEISDQFRNDDVNTSFDVSNKRDHSIHKLRENSFGYVNSMKGMDFLEEMRKEFNISYLIETKKRYHNTQSMEGTLTIYGTSINVEEAGRKLNNFFNFMPSFHNIPKSSKPAFNFLTLKLDQIDKINPDYRTTYNTLLKLQSSLRSGGKNPVVKKKKLKDLRIQLNIVLFGKLLFGDGQKHINFLNQLCMKYGNGDESYKIPLNELFDLVDSYSYIFLDTVKHDYQSYISADIRSKHVAERNLTNVYKFMKLVGMKCQKSGMYDELKQLNELKCYVERSSSVKAYNEFKTYCLRLLKYFRCHRIQ